MFILHLNLARMHALGVSRSLILWLEANNRNQIGVSWVKNSRATRNSKKDSYALASSPMVKITWSAHPKKILVTTVPHWNTLTEMVNFPFFNFTYCIFLLNMEVSLRMSCCNLSAGVALNARFTTNGMCAKNNTEYIWREQAIIELSWRVISIVACCHSVWREQAITEWSSCVSSADTNMWTVERND